MLMSKTFCPAGSLVYIVPTGLQLTLRYDLRGNLINVFEGFGTTLDLGDEFLKAIVRMGLVPNGIKITGGITDIWGVFYSNKFEANNGLLPECEYERIKADILSGTPGYKFYAGFVKSGATSLIDPSTMQVWLKSAKFEVLPTWLVPAEATEDALKTHINNTMYPFQYPLIAGYIIYESANAPTYQSVDLRTFTVDKVKQHVDSNGYIKYDISNNGNTITVDLPEATNYNVQKGSQLITDRNRIIWSRNADNAKMLIRRIPCEYCGKIIDVPMSGIACCDDPTCTSFLFSKIERFCTQLDLKVPTFAAVKKLIKSGELQTLSDLLLLPDYSEVKIEKPLWEVINAVIPGEVGVPRDWLIKFCNKCNNEYKTVKYYLNGPLRINTELEMEVPIRFARWLDAGDNMLQLDTIVNSTQVTLVDVGRLSGINVPPLLHDKTILITGVFKHGSTSDIFTILQSYGAIVVTDFDEFIDYVVVGDIKDGINGEAILGAKGLKIPVVDENVFFAHYGIDADLESNLV